jgi:hypothetical protein
MTLNLNNPHDARPLAPRQLREGPPISVANFIRVIYNNYRLNAQLRRVPSQKEMNPEGATPRLGQNTGSRGAALRAGASAHRGQLPVARLVPMSFQCVSIGGWHYMCSMA